MVLLNDTIQWLPRSSWHETVNFFNFPVGVCIDVNFPGIPFSQQLCLLHVNCLHTLNYIYLEVMTANVSYCEPANVVISCNHDRGLAQHPAKLWMFALLTNRVFLGTILVTDFRATIKNSMDVSLLTFCLFCSIWFFTSHQQSFS